MIFCEPPHDIKHHEADGAVSGATLLRFPLGVSNQVSNNRHGYQRTSADDVRQVRRVSVVVGDLARWLRDEEAAGSNPATPTQVRR